MKTISAQELKKKMDNNVPMIVAYLLDTAEYGKCHIKNSVSAPIGLLPERAQEWDKKQLIVIYSDGPMAEHINQKGHAVLSEMGFNNILIYDKNLTEWLQLEYPVEGKACWVE